MLDQLIRPGPVSARTWEMLPPRWSWHNWGLTESRSSHRLLRPHQPRLPVLKVRARAGIIWAVHGVASAHVASRGTVTPAHSHSLSPQLGSNSGCISPAIIGRSQKAHHNALTRCSRPRWHVSMLTHVTCAGGVLIMSHETLGVAAESGLCDDTQSLDTAAQLGCPGPRQDIRSGHEPLAHSQ